MKVFVYLRQFSAELLGKNDKNYQIYVQVVYFVNQTKKVLKLVMDLKIVNR